MMTPKIAQVLYGGEYHPEAWPEPLWNEDMALMRRAGVNLVTLGALTWNKLQPTPDTFDFEWLDRVMNLLHTHGILAGIVTPACQPPPWLTRLYHERQDGSSSPFGSCLNNPVFREHGDRLVRRLSQHLGAHPTLAFWQVTLPLSVGGPSCRCELCTVKFRIWLQSRYRTLDVLNEHWGTGAAGGPYQHWEEVAFPSDLSQFATPAHQLDYLRFQSDALLEYFLSAKSVLREAAPELPVTTLFNGETGISPCLNAFQWSKHVDFIAWNFALDPLGAESADLAFGCDVQRGVGEGRAWLLKFVTSPPCPRVQNPVLRPGQVGLWSAQAIAHGADGILFSQWRAPNAGSDKFEPAMLPHGLTETRAFREVEQLGGTLKKLAAVMGATARSEVALVLDWESMWAVESNSSPARINYAELLRSYYRALFEPDVPIDIIPAEADLTKYKLVVAPALHVVRAGVAENLYGFVDNGGTLITTFLSGIVDASLRILPGGYPAAFRKLLGIHVEAFDVFGAEIRHMKTALRGARCTAWADIIQLEGAEAVAAFTDDFYAHQAAITRNALGRGLAYYVGTQPEPAFLRSLLAEICSDSGVRPPMRAPAGVEVTTRFNDQGEFLFLLNHNPTIQFVDIGPRIRRDLISGEMIKGQCQLESRAVRVLQLA